MKSPKGEHGRTGHGRTGHGRAGHLGVLVAGLSIVFLLLPAIDAGAAAGNEIDLQFDRTTFFELAGRTLSAGFTLTNYRPTAADLSIELRGSGLTVVPSLMNLTLSGAGRTDVKFNVSSASEGNYFIIVALRDGLLTTRHLADIIFLPPLSCKFISPVTSERTAVLGMGQSYTARVNLTSFSASSMSPGISMTARDLASPPPGVAPSDTVKLPAGELAPGASNIFSFEGRAPAEMTTQEIVPAVIVGENVAAYGFDVGPGGVYNVTLFMFVLSSREMVGVELSQDTFRLGEKSTVMMYVECRKSGGMVNGSLDIGLKTDIEARSELSDYAAQARFEHFIPYVKSKVSFDTHFGLPPMEQGVQELFQFDFTPRICRASEEAAGSFYLEFWAVFGSTPASTTRPVSVISPLSMALETHEKVMYASLGELVTRRVNVKNISNSTIRSATASFFLDFRGAGTVGKSDIADVAPVSIPVLEPGEEMTISLGISPKSPGTYEIFPLISWSGLAVYGSHITVVASGSSQVPFGAYFTAVIAIIVPVAVTRKYTP